MLSCFHKVSRLLWRKGWIGAGLLLYSGLLQADYAIQVGVYEKPAHAAGVVEKLRRAGFPVITQPVSALRTRVLVGPYVRHRAAQAILTQLQDLGESGFIRQYTEANPTSKQTLPTEPTPRVASRATNIPQVALATASPAPVELGAPLTDSAPTQVPEPNDSTSSANPPSIEEPLELDTMGRSSRLTGFFQSELAYAWDTPAHLSKFRDTLQLATQGNDGPRLGWKLSGWLAYDPVFDLTDYYPEQVQKDRRFQAEIRETYLDIGAGDWDFRLGRQQIIWGEMVGLFFADVVSAEDLREFVLQDFDMLRIPQWAARSEFFQGDFHAEAIWIPYPTYDDIGKPGDDFYPYPPPVPAGYTSVFLSDDKPVGNIDDSGYGLRLSYLMQGWDLSTFFYSSMNATPTLFRQIVNTPTPTFVYQPRHDRIEQYGGTLAKDFSPLLLRAEMVYTQNEDVEVTDLSVADGVVRQNVLEYIVGIEYTLPHRSTLDLQFFQSWYPDHDPGMIEDRWENGASFLASTYLADNLQAQILWLVGLNRGDWLARPRLEWELGPSWRWDLGADVFNGSPDGLFGRYADKDRAYTEVRYTF